MRKIQHHLTEATLMSYAAGSLPEALSAVVKAHLSVCKVCSERLETMQLIGGVLLEDLPGEKVDATPLPTKLRLNDNHDTDNALAPKHGAQHEIDPESVIPAPLQPFIGTSLDDVPWKRLGLGIWHAPVGPMKQGGRGDLRLIKVAPGQVMPEHSHGGTELTLVLDGSYTDEVSTFGALDVEDVDCDTEHQPVSHHKTGCICLIASEKPAKYKGLVPRLVQPLIGI